MTRISRGKRCHVLASATWAAGLAAIWWLTPVGPRGGSQPSADQYVCGFLRDGRSLVTAQSGLVERRSGGKSLSGPIRVWDVESGELRASYFGADDVFRGVQLVPGNDLLQIQRREYARGDHCFRLGLVEATTGRIVASFRCDDPFENVNWMVSPDGHTVAVETFANGQPQIECYDVATGLLRFLLPGWRAPMCFCPEGYRLAASWSKERPDVFFPQVIGVWEIPSGKEVAQLAAPLRRGDINYPRALSPNGELLLDFKWQVWDVTKGTIRFKSPNPNNAHYFTPDGRYLAVTTSANLYSYDVLTGNECLERRVECRTDGLPVTSFFQSPVPHLWYRQGGWMRRPFAQWQWLAKRLNLNSFDVSRYEEVFLLIDAANGRELMQGEGQVSCCSADGRYLVTGNYHGEYQLWDIPPRKPLRWLLPTAAAWSAAIGLFTWWRLRRSRSLSRAAGSC